MINLNHGNTEIKVLQGGAHYVDKGAEAGTDYRAGRGGVKGCSQGVRVGRGKMGRVQALNTEGGDISIDPLFDCRQMKFS